MAGAGTCDACHTRHTFSRKEALQPQACQTCHQGNDHPQWLMYEGSKHGVRAKLKQVGALPENAGAPTCQTCHMPDGNHYVKTAWGFFGFRLPLPDDPEWAADMATVMRAFGMLDGNGNPTPAIEAANALGLFRLTKADFDMERQKMTAVCTQCHAPSMVETEFKKGDALVREAHR